MSLPRRSRAGRKPGRDGNQIRVIGGQWRGRRLVFPDVPGLRPSGDRLRETLFNWLQPVMAGSRCLDLFAGSGALGFEAASRGAASVVMVERSHRAAAGLRRSVESLSAAALVEIVEADAEGYLQVAPAPFDLVFIDPPFASALLEPACRGLIEHGLLRLPTAWVYLEMDARNTPPVLPQAWCLHRQSRQGEVLAQLYRVEQIAAPPTFRQSPA